MLLRITEVSKELRIHLDVKSIYGHLLPSCNGNADAEASWYHSCGSWYSGCAPCDAFASPCYYNEIKTNSSHQFTPHHPYPIQINPYMKKENCCGFVSGLSRKCPYAPFVKWLHPFSYWIWRVFGIGSSSFHCVFFAYWIPLPLWFAGSMPPSMPVFGN